MSIQAYIQEPNPSSAYTLITISDIFWETVIERALHGIGYLAPAQSIVSHLRILFDVTGDFDQPGVEIVTTLTGYRRRSLFTGEWLDQLWKVFRLPIGRNQR